METSTRIGLGTEYIELAETIRTIGSETSGEKYEKREIIKLFIIISCTCRSYLCFILYGQLFIYSGVPGTRE